jgi:hypothetical protein
MEKGSSFPNYKPDTHCAFCGRTFRSKKDRRPIGEQDGLQTLGGQTSLLGDTLFIGAKFACLDCFGRNNAELTVLVSLATLCDTSLLAFSVDFPLLF